MTMLIESKLLMYGKAANRIITVGQSLSKCSPKRVRGRFQLTPLDVDKDRQELLNLLIGAYRKNWPLIHLLPEVPKDFDQFLTRKIDYNLKHGPGLSFGIRDLSTHKLTGALLGCTSAKNGSKSEVFGYTENMQQVIRFMEHTEGDIFSDLKTDSVAKMGVRAVDPAYGNLGLMGRLVDAFTAAAANTGVKNVIGMSLSEFTNRLHARAGHKLLRKVEYSSYIDGVTGLKPFTRLVPPHTHAILYLLNNPKQQN